MTVAATLQEALRDCFGKAPIELDRKARLVEDLDLDSLDYIQLVMEVEDRLGISIPYREAERCRTVGDLLDAIEAAEAEAQKLRQL